VATRRNSRYDRAVTAAALHADARGADDLISKGMFIGRKWFSVHLLSFNSTA
jgi:hypothetical protein